MLTSVHIQRFRSCRDVTVDNMSGVTLFIGPNGAGKTNFFRAIKWAADVAINGADSKEFGAFHAKASVDMAFTADGEQYRYSLKVGMQTPATASAATAASHGLAGPRLIVTDTLTVKVDEEWQTMVTRDEAGIRIKDLPSAPCAPGQGAVTLAFLNTSTDPQTFSDWDRRMYIGWNFLNSVRYYSLELPPVPESYFNGLELKKYESDTPWGSSSNDLKKLVLLHRDRKDAFKELEALLGPDTLGILTSINVRTLTPPTGQESPDSTVFFPSFAPANFHADPLVSYEDLSFGTRRIFSLVLAMIADHASVMLIEQPEDGIHPGLLKKLLAVLKSYANPQQFLLTSHSPAVINVLKPTDIRLVEMSEAVTTVRPLSQGELRQANDYMSLEGTLADFIKALES